MKSAVFALLFSSVFAQENKMPKEGDEMWNKIMEEHEKGSWKAYKKGMMKPVDMKPRVCNISRDCPMQYRMGGCCGTAKIIKGAEYLKGDTMKQYFENTGANYCIMGSGVDAFNKLGPEVNYYDYSKMMWESDPLVRVTWGQVSPKEDFKSFDDVNDFLKMNMPDMWVDPKAPLIMQGQCTDERLLPIDMVQTCSNSNDCQDSWGHFAGGCCGKSEITKNAERADDMTRKLFNLQGKNTGICATRLQADYVEKRGESNLFEWDKYMFENDFLVRNIWLHDMPYGDRDDVKWDDVMEHVKKDYQKEYDQIQNAREIYFKGYCMDSRLGGEPPNYREWMDMMMKDDDWDMERLEKLQDMFDDIKVDMGDNFVKITGEGMRIEMMEGEDGSGRMSIILESATKLAASAAALAAMTLY